jgi:protoheme IX farnesyltransferase
MKTRARIHPRPPNPYLELIKARLSLLVLSTTAVGFALAARGRLDLGRFSWTLAGTWLAAAGANALNQWWEARPDGLMERTRMRPIPAHVFSRRHALLVGLTSAAAGISLLAGRVNLLTAALGASVILLYVLAYTPLKRRTPFCTLVGAVCGAIPPVMGWTGASGSIGFGAWILALVLFLWQIPHFLALAWLYREDYARGGFRMLPSIDPSGRITGSLAVVYIAALLPLGATFFFTGMAGRIFLAGSLLLGSAFFALGFRLFLRRDQRVARGLFLGSILYLPLLLALLLADPGPARSASKPLAALPSSAPAEVR